MVNIELCFRGRFFFYHRSGKLSLFLLLRPIPLPNLRNVLCSHRTVSKWFWSRPDLFTWDRFIYEHLFTRNRYRNGPLPVHFWTNVRKSAVCTNKLSTGRPKHVKDDRRNLNLWIERSQRSLARYKLPHPCRLQNPRPKYTSF